MFERYRYHPAHRPDAVSERSVPDIEPKALSDIPRGISMGASLVLLRKLAENQRAQIEQTTHESNAKDIDPKTGLQTALAWERYVRNRLAHHRRNDAETHVLMIDLDHFKRFNDEYGHLWGDVALRLFGHAILSGLLRTDDSAGLGENKYQAEDAGRFGGEEAAVALFNTDMSGALTVAERIRSNIGAVSYLRIVEAVENKSEVLPEAWAKELGKDTAAKRTLLASSGSLSASIGIGRIDTGSVDLDSGLHQADTALYNAKAQGRNQIVAYWQLPSVAN